MSTRVQQDSPLRPTYEDHLLDVVEQDRRNQYIKGTLALIAVALVVALLAYGFIELAAVV